LSYSETAFFRISSISFSLLLTHWDLDLIAAMCYHLQMERNPEKFTKLF
jgi:hypothetical protein